MGYLGHKISAQALQPTDEKMQAIKEVPAPSPQRCARAEVIYGAGEPLWQVSPTLITNFCSPIQALAEGDALELGEEQQVFPRCQELANI